MRLVLLPGLDGTGLLFEPLCRALSSAVQTTILDYPRGRETSYDELAAQIGPKLPTAEPFMLLGESYGGPLSLKLAAQEPAGLCGLILSASFITSPHSYIPKWAAPMLIPAMVYSTPLFSSLTTLLGAHSTNEIQSLVEKSVASVDPAVLGSRMKAAVSVDVTKELLACPVPILYIQATQDYVVPANNLTEIQQVRPDVRAVQIEGAHMVLLTRAKAAAGAIESFAMERAEN